MPDYRSISVFDDVIDDESEENIIETYREYSLVQDDNINPDGTYNYKIFDDFGVLVKMLKAKFDALSATLSAYNNSNIRKVFTSYVNDVYMKRALKRKEDQEKAAQAAAREQKPKTPARKTYPRYYDDSDDDDEIPYRYSNLYSNNGGYTSYSNYRPVPKSTGFLDKLNKSNTLVIHCQDRTTDMLSQIYNGKGWDVLRDGNIDKDELHKLIQSHDRIVCLGHGTPGGLINKQGGGYTIGPEEAPFLKDKNIFAIWCNADKYFKQHNIGHGCFITKNVPSEVIEAKWIGYNVSAEWMLENITYWSKCCADVVDQALNGDVRGAVEKARREYQKVYGDDSDPDQKGVTDYNTDAIQVQP